MYVMSYEVLVFSGSRREYRVSHMEIREPLILRHTVALIIAICFASFGCTEGKPLYNKHIDCTQR